MDRRKRNRGKAGHLPPGELSTGAAAKVAGLARLTLWRWVTRGILQPRRHGGDGKGGALGWRLHDVVAARAVAHLRSRLSAQMVRRIAKELEKHGRDLASAVLLVDARGGVQVLSDSGNLADLFTGQYALPLGPVAEKFRAAVEREDRERRIA